ncbi:MAG: fibronectin type III domain-containing protein [Ardenticatenaceae bacterium]|nr:fibronectin type III domain-containing protein [Ardenticatenaceae bacterium]
MTGLDNDKFSLAMKLKKAFFVRLVPLVLAAVILAFLSTGVSYAFPVPELPNDNLLTNPWFRSSSDSSQPGFDGWTQQYTDGVSWGPSQKASNPAPDVVVSGKCPPGEQSCGTAARWAEQAGILYPNIDVFAYQVVSADPTQRNLKFFTYYVSHRVEVGAVNIYGSDSADGPWTLVWVPLYHSQSEQIVPDSRDVTDLWEDTGFIERPIEQGFPFYKVEIQSRLPEWHMIRGVGFKITGLYFATEETNEPGLPLPVGTPMVTTGGATGEVATLEATDVPDAAAAPTIAPNTTPGNGDEAIEAEMAESPVTTLMAEPVSATEIALTWNASESNSRGFSLERSLDGTTGWRTIARVRPEDSQFTDEGLAPNTLYYYRLKATQEDVSAEAMAKTLTLEGSNLDSDSELSEEQGGDEIAQNNLTSDSEQPNLTVTGEQATATDSAMQIGILIGFAIAIVLFTAVFLFMRQKKQV